MLHAAELSLAPSERKIVCNAGILWASPQAVIPHAFSVLCPNAAGKTGRAGKAGKAALLFAAGKTGRTALLFAARKAGRTGRTALPFSGWVRKRRGRKFSSPAAILKTHALCDATFTCG